MTDAEKLNLITQWLHPGLWGTFDSRRTALEKIIAGEQVLPPPWVAEGLPGR